MERNCKVCSRRDVEAIGRARFEEKLSFEAVAARFKLSKTTIQRHFDHATPPGDPPPAVDEEMDPPKYRGAGRPCVVCPSPFRQEIERLLVSNLSAGTIEKRVGPKGPSEEGIERHARECIPMMLERARVRFTVGTVQERVNELISEVQDFLNDAKASEEWQARAAALQRLERSLHLLAKLTGELRETDEDAIRKTSAWKLIVATFDRVLLPYPEAAAALRAGLAVVDAG